VISYRSGLVQLFDPKTNQLHGSHQTTLSSIESIAKYTETEFLIGGEKDIILLDTSFKIKKTLEGHTDAVVKLFVDNHVLYSASEDFSIRSWNLGSGHSTILYSHESPVISMDISPSLKAIASSCSDSHLYIFSVNNNKIISSDKQLESKAWSLKFINSEHIAIGTHDSTIFIRNVSDLKEVHRLEGHESRVKDLDFYSEFDLLVSVSFDQKILIWKNFEKKETVEEHGDWIRKVCFTQDGENIVSVGDDSKLVNIKFEISQGATHEFRWCMLLFWIFVLIAVVIGVIDFTTGGYFRNLFVSAWYSPLRTPQIENSY
jgi:WD40 repeat protein